MRASPILLRITRKHPLTTKKQPHGYYKGNRTGRMGDHTKYGGYRINYDKVRTYVVPENLRLPLWMSDGEKNTGGMDRFMLTPFVTRKLIVRPGKSEEGTGQASGASYLEMWKRENGDD